MLAFSGLNLFREKIFCIKIIAGSSNICLILSCFVIQNANPFKFSSTHIFYFCSFFKNSAKHNKTISKIFLKLDFQIGFSLLSVLIFAADSNFYFVLSTLHFCFFHVSDFRFYCFLYSASSFCSIPVFQRKPELVLLYL